MLKVLQNRFRRWKMSNARASTFFSTTVTPTVSWIVSNRETLAKPETDISNVSILSTSKKGLYDQTQYHLSNGGYQVFL
jgi:hypothetical protein